MSHNVGVAEPVGGIREITVIMALTGIVLLGLDSSFASEEYLVVGVFGCVAALLTGATVSGLGRNTEVFLLAAPLVWVVFGTVVAYREGQPLGVPTPGRMVDFLAAAITAPEDFLTTIAPVDAVGGVMVLPFTIGFVAAASSGWLALHTTRPVAPAVPLVAALAVTVLLGLAEPTWVEIRSVSFAALTLWWVSARSADAAAIRHATRGRWLRAVATLVLVAAIASALSLFGPRPDKNDGMHSSRSVLRGEIGSGTDVSHADNPLADFRRYTPRPPVLGKSVYDVPLLRVSGLERGDRLRFAALDVYDGQHWVAGNRTVAGAKDALFQRVGTTIAAPEAGDEVTVVVEVLRGYASNWLPTAGDVVSLDFDYSDREAQLDDVRYNLATNSAYVVGGVGRGDDYTFTTVLSQEQLPRRALAYPAGRQLQPTGRFLDLFLYPWFETDASPMQRVRSVAHFLRENGFYSDGIGPHERHVRGGHDEQRLGYDFVAADSIVGNDEQYAAAMALLANRLTVPARVVVGAAVPADGVVRGHHVSAWVEVRVVDGSWRTLDTSEFMPDMPLPVAPERGLRAEDYVREQSDSLNRDPRDRARTDSRSTRDRGSGDESLVWWWLAVLLVPMAVPTLKWWRRRRSRTYGCSEPERLVLGWRELVRMARDLGHDVPPWLDRPEQARLLGIDERLAHDVDRVTFAAPTGAPEASLAGVEDRIAEAQSELSRRANRWRRLSAPFSLRSYVSNRQKGGLPRDRGAD